MWTYENKTKRHTRNKTVDAEPVCVCVYVLLVLIEKD
jgi:hypothetical protein